jgi:hypothetical protein
MSGCWSYFLEMYCRMDEASEIWVDFRKGSDRMLELQRKGGVSGRMSGCGVVRCWVLGFRYSRRHLDFFCRLDSNLPGNGVACAQPSVAFNG